MSFIFVALMLRETSRTIIPLRWFARTSFFVGRRSAVSAAASSKQSAAIASRSRCTVVRRIAALSPAMSATGMPARRRVLSRPAIALRENRLTDLSCQRDGCVTFGCRLGPGEHARRQREVILARTPELVSEQLQRLALLGHDPVCSCALDEEQRILERRRKRPLPSEPGPEPVEENCGQREQGHGDRHEQRLEQRR